MTHDRRQLLSLAAAGLAATALTAAAQAGTQINAPRYGLVGQMLAAPGKRDELVACLRDATLGMPGCLSYVIALDAANPDAIWITEVWDSKESHAASLKLPAVRAAITRAKPIIAGFGHRFETVPVAGL